MRLGGGLRTRQIEPTSAAKQSRVSHFRTSGRSSDAPVGAAGLNLRLVRRRLLPGSGKTWFLPGLVVTVVASLVLRLQGEPVAVALSGRWAVALILEPVPNVSAGRAIARTGRLDAFW